MKQIVEFNCIREDPKQEGEYIFFGTNIEPTTDFNLAIERVKQRIKQDGWNEKIWVCGFWKGKSCYEGGFYTTIDWIPCY